MGITQYQVIPLPRIKLHPKRTLSRSEKRLTRYVSYQDRNSQRRHTKAASNKLAVYNIFTKRAKGTWKKRTRKIRIAPRLPTWFSSVVLAWRDTAFLHRAKRDAMRSMWYGHFQQRSTLRHHYTQPFSLPANKNMTKQVIPPSRSTNALVDCGLCSNQNERGL